MTLTRAVARPMLAGIFIVGGIDAVRNPEGKAKRAENVVLPLASHLHLPTDDPVALVRLNGVVQVAGGALLAVGRAPRLGSLALMGSLIPTTYAGHRWWEENDKQIRVQQRIQFLKNMGMLGGLVLAATETNRRRSRPKQSARRTRHLAKGAPAAVGLTTLELSKQAIRAAERAARDTARSQPVQSTTAAARHAAERARELAQDVLSVAG